MPNTNKAKRLKRFFIDVEPSILESSYPNISISNNYIVYTQKFGRLIFLHIILTLLSLILAYFVNPFFYIGLVFIPIGIFLNKIFPNQGKIYFDEQGIISENFFHIKKKYLYDDIIDIYFEDSPTRYNIYGLLKQDKFIIALSLTQEDCENLIKILKAVVTIEGNLPQKPQK